MSVDPGQMQSLGNGVVNDIEAQRLALGARAGQLSYSGVPNGKPGLVSLGKGRQVPINPADRKFYNRPGVMEAYKKSGQVPIDYAISEYDNQSTEELQAWHRESSRFNNYDMRKNPRQMAYDWNNTIQELANYQARTGNYDIGPTEYLRMKNDRLQAAGLQKSYEEIVGGGAGGAYRGPVTTFSKDTVIDITNPSQAKLLVDSALQNYLGRDATGEERQTFMDALNKLQREQPQYSESVTKSGAPGGATQTQNRMTKQRAGVDARAVAEEFARSRETAAEQRMGGKYMDWFMQKVMSAPDTEKIASGL